MSMTIGLRCMNCEFPEFPPFRGLARRGTNMAG
jgi:hypothetical protein